jgi:Fe-S cluster assembly ATP-binding protein
MQWNGHDLLAFSSDKRAQLGLFVSLQNSPEIPGLSVFLFLKECYRAITGKEVMLAGFKEQVILLLGQLGLNEHFLERSVNEGFSGGEKKRFEVLQLLLFKPKLAILDEIDSGLDVDALRLIGTALADFKKTHSCTLILITHYRHILRYVEPEFVHIMKSGTITTSGDAQLIQKIESQGYNAPI